METENNDNPVLTFKEALEYIEKNHAKISGVLLRGIIERREITYMRPGGKLFKFRKHDLDTWIKSQIFEAKPQTQA